MTQARPARTARERGDVMSRALTGHGSDVCQAASGNGSPGASMRPRHAMVSPG